MPDLAPYAKDDLRNALPPDRLALLRLAADEASARGLPLYLVGGFARDLLLGRPATDFDLVVEGDAIGFARSLSGKYGGKVTSHSRFGTAIWTLDDSTLARLSEPVNLQPANIHTLDFITARSETYKHPAALPTVRPGALSDDLRRRDFTINTLALRLDGKYFGQLRDELGGLSDLEQGVVRVLHPLSYVDDPTRILRAVRYEQRYGFRIASPDLELIEAARGLIARLSAERIRHELDLILKEQYAARMLARLAELGVLKSIHTCLPWNKRIEKELETGLHSETPASWGRLPGLPGVPRQEALGYLLWLMRLPHEEINAIDDRLHFPAALRNALLSASALWPDVPMLPGARPPAICDRLENVPPLAIFSNYLVSKGKSRKLLDTYMTGWRFIKPNTTGDDLKALGLPPGPVYQSILSRLRAAWLEGEIKTEQEERLLLEKLIKNKP